MMQYDKYLCQDGIGNICRVGYGVARMLIEDGQTDKPVMIGYDRRFLSDSAAGWLAQVFAARRMQS